MKNNVKNSYYSSVLGRQNVLKAFIGDIALLLCSYPRLLLEVFIRKNFGQRYFNMMSVITVVAILAYWPYFNPGFFSFTENSSKIFPDYFCWYVFLAAFLLISIKRYYEVLNGPSVYDFDKYSLYSGEKNSAFYNIKIGNEKPSVRVVETILEPALFFILGLVLMLFHQKLGGLLVVSSILYSLSYFAAYAKGDNFIMDKIDEIICNEETQKVLVDGMDSRDAKYFEMRNKLPSNKAMRQKIADMMVPGAAPVEVE